MYMKRKPVVWYVDDLRANLEDFKRKHGKVFAIETFSNPHDVLEALETSKPDALLRDVFFYKNNEVAEDIEAKVSAKAKDLIAFGESIAATKPENQAGIELIAAVCGRFRNKFPIYAYTSKGAYLLDQVGFDRIADAGAKWLFKKKYGAVTEQFLIAQDVEEFRVKNSISIMLLRYFWVAVFGSGILGGLVVWFLTEKLPKLVGG